MTNSLLVDAAHNNAVWHEAVCRTHGAGGEFRPAAWLTLKEPPVYYGNCVTLLPDAVEEQYGAARELVNARPARGCGFKDSFDRLDLNRLGFRVLFKATWIARDPTGGDRGHRRGSDITVEEVRSPSGLSSWERAWGETPANAQASVFQPPLLDDPDVAFMLARRADTIIGGGIANRSRDVVGLSNLFLPETDSLQVRLSLVDHASKRFPGLTAVGYEHGKDLDAMLEAGFEKIGPLTVWLRDAPRS